MTAAAIVAAENRATIHARQQRERAELIEDVLWLLDTGTAPAEIPRRLGTNAAALERRLRRGGENALACVIDSGRRSSCVDCGGDAHWRSTRCHRCHCKHAAQIRNVA